MRMPCLLKLGPKVPTFKPTPLRRCRSWLADSPCGRDFDLGLIYYGSNPGFACPECAFVRRARGAKWRLLHELLADPTWFRRVGAAAWRCKASQLSRSVAAHQLLWLASTAALRRVQCCRSSRTTMWSCTPMMTCSCQPQI